MRAGSPWCQNVRMSVAAKASPQAPPLPPLWAGRYNWILTAGSKMGSLSVIIIQALKCDLQMTANTICTDHMSLLYL